jgi:hypothetical protein
LAGEGVGKDEGLTMARFMAGDGAVRPPARWGGRVRRWWSLEWWFRRDGDHNGAKGGSGVFGWPWKRLRRRFRPRRPSRRPRRTTTSLCAGGSELGTGEGD